MSIQLSDHEKGGSFDGDYAGALTAIQQRLSHAHARHIVHARRTMIVMEGWDAAGKGGVIKRMTAEWDPRYFQVWPISAPTVYEKDRHFLWRFWQKLPGSREVCVFDRSWYGRVLVERVEGFCTERDWKRGYDEINEFEAQQVDGGTTIIKVFLHVTQATQDKRLADRLAVPEKRWKVTEDDFRNRARRADYLEAMHTMFRQTDTRWAPWAVFDANNKKAARIAVLTHIADQLDASLPKSLPEADPALIAMAKAAFGFKE